MSTNFQEKISYKMNNLRASCAGFSTAGSKTKIFIKLCINKMNIRIILNIYAFSIDKPNLRMYNPVQTEKKHPWRRES